MAAVLLVLFPLLLMVNTHAAWVALAAAIVMLCSKSLGSGPRAPRPRHPAEHDASI